MIRSHKNPDKPLWNETEGHLLEVYTGMKNILLSLNLDEIFLSKNKIDLYCKIIGFSHDIGKATHFFQKKLETEKDTYEEPSGHSKIGAAFAFYLCDQLKLSEKEGFLIYRLICSHHSSQHKDIDDLTLGDNDIRNIKLQIEDILSGPESLIIFSNIYSLFLATPFLKENFITFIDNINKFITRYGIRLSIQSSLDEKRNYEIVLYFILYSAFSRADKYNALFRKPLIIDIEERERNNYKINDEIVDVYKYIDKKENPEKYQDTELNRLRQVFYQDIQESVGNIDLDKDRILQANAPTGIGKTLTLLNAAIKLKNRVFKETGKCYRIIYSLPFLSIIDQTAKIIGDILDHNNIEQNTDIFLEYHHLADTITRKSSDDEIQYEDEEGLMLNRFWDSEIILTTFVSFMEVFSSGENLLKLINIANSIVILDEIQAVEAGLYPCVKWFIQILARYFNCFIIITTATMPNIFESNEITDLYHTLELHDQLYRFSNRYSIIRLPDMKIDDFINYFLNPLSYRQTTFSCSFRFNFWPVPAVL